MGNKIIINKRELNAVLLYLVTQITLLLFAYYSQYDSFDFWINKFSIILLLNIFSTYYIFLKLEIKMFSLINFSILLCYLFHFGQIITLFINPYYSDNQQDNFLRILDFEIIQVAAIYSLVTIFFIVLGVISVNLDTNKNRSLPFQEISLIKMNQLKIIGWFLLIICFPIQIFIDYKKMTSFFYSGYLAIFDTAVNGYIGELGYLSFSAFAILILIYSKSNKRKSIVLFIIVVSYLILTMASGSRGKQLTFLLLYVYIFHKTVYKLNWKIFALVGVLGVALLNLLSTVALFRALPNKDVMNFWNIYLVSLKNGPVLGIIYELGGTIQTVYQVIKQVPNQSYQGNGLTYITSWFTILPNVGDKMTDLNESAHFVKNIRGSALGGSIVGELFYNFRYWGIVVAPLIGIFISKISNLSDKFIESEEYYKFIFIIPLFVNILWWTRDAFVTIPRAFLFSSIVLLTLFKCMELFKKKNF